MIDGIAGIMDTFVTLISHKVALSKRLHVSIPDLRTVAMMTVWDIWNPTITNLWTNHSIWKQNQKEDLAALIKIPVIHTMF